MTMFSASNGVTVCAILATSVATYTFCSLASNPKCSLVNLNQLTDTELPRRTPTSWRSNDSEIFSASTTKLARQSYTRGAVALEDSASIPHNLCPIHGDGSSSNELPLYKGRWIYDESITTYPYLGGEDYVWGPLCTELEKRYLFDGTLPAFLKYRWQPDSCDVARFERTNFCRLLSGKSIGIIGDSMNQQFAHSLVGMMLGHLPSNFTNPPHIDYSKPNQVVELCPYNEEGHSVTMIFVRWNKYTGREEDRAIVADLAQRSDYLVMNFGVHYQPWLEMENATKDLIDVLEENWGRGETQEESSSSHLDRIKSKNNHKKKKPQRLFWRSTVVAHDNCANSTGPLHQEDGNGDDVQFHKNPKYNTDEIMLQDREIAQPLLLASSVLNVTFLNVERTTMAHRSDGHRVVGHNSNEDCLHYCEPGPTDSWVELFYHHVVMGV